jgi:predicted nucleotidyltransferase
MDLAKVRKRLEARHTERWSRLERQRRTFLLKIQAALPDFLSDFPEVSKVVVFGSLLRKGYFTELSDVDIAVKDLPNAKYWQAAVWWDHRLESEDIDLVQIEEVNSRILKYIDQGKVVYEKKV